MGSFFLIIKICIFIFDCAGSLLLCRFSLVVARRLLIAVTFFFFNFIRRASVAVALRL